MKLIALLLRPFVVSFLLDKRARSLLCTSHRALKFKEVLLCVSADQLGAIKLAESLYGNEGGLETSCFMIHLLSNAFIKIARHMA
jgi:hypothetical protein